MSSDDETCVCRDYTPLVGKENAQIKFLAAQLAVKLFKMVLAVQ